MPSEVFGFYPKDNGKPLKDFELGIELTKLVFWKDLLTAASRVDGFGQELCCVIASTSDSRKYLHF